MHGAWQDLPTLAEPSNERLVIQGAFTKAGGADAGALAELRDFTEKRLVCLDRVVWHGENDSRIFPTLSMGRFRLRDRWEVSYPRAMLSLREIVVMRLAELKLGAVEAASKAGISRDYIRDLVEEKKESVNSSGIKKLAKALDLDADALARNEIVRLEDMGGKAAAEAIAEINAIARRVKGAHLEKLLQAARDRDALASLDGARPPEPPKDDER